MASYYQNLVLASSPLAYWRFDEASLPYLGVISDSTGNNRPLIVQYNTAIPRSVINGRSLGFGAKPANGGGFKANTTTDFSFEYNTPFSVQFWFFGTGTSPGVGYVTFFNKCPDAVPYNGYDLYAYQGYLSFMLRTDSATSQWMDRDYVWPSTLWAAEWTHLAATYDGSGNRSGMKVYINGALETPAQEQGLSSMSTSILVPAKKFDVGQRDAGSGQMYFYGNFSEMAVYDRELAASEIFDFASFIPILDLRDGISSPNVIRSVARPAKNLIAEVGSSLSARKSGSKLGPGIG